MRFAPEGDMTPAFRSGGGTTAEPPVTVAASTFVVGEGGCWKKCTDPTPNIMKRITPGWQKQMKTFMGLE
ncbi:hypothetical protein ACFL5O_06730 [Myxococcota bacterium]